MQLRLFQGAKDEVVQHAGESNGRGGEEVTSRDLSYDTTSLKGGLSQSLHVQCIHIIKESMAASGPARTIYVQSTHELSSMHFNTFCTNPFR